MKAFFAPLAGEWRYGRVVLLALVLWYLTAQILHLYLGTGSRTSMADTKWINKDVLLRLAQFLFILAIVRTIQFGKRKGDVPLLKAVVKAARPRPAALLRWAILALVSLLGFAVFLSNIMSIKTTIPEFVPFYFDGTAMAIDRALFFGRDGWQVLAPLYEFKGIIRLIDILYSVIWAVILGGSWFYCCTSKAMDGVRRYQFCLALIILFVIGGNFLATVFSSVGPVYYAHFFGGQDYAGLTDELARIGSNVPLMAVEVQERLLALSQDSVNPINGISAVPSMHVGTTVLMLILFWQAPLARMVTLVFTGFIFIGSIILGWHYAIDGLAAVPIAILCWYLAGWCLRRFAGRPESIR